ncbi:MAG: bifunctional diaminohydroxyphosphoribosylaminopyrimidine deaminase/5-amino-6-(5-phosphoribosylamino)uracil reductase RibD [Armatimonadota bacterium]
MADSRPDPVDRRWMRRAIALARRARPSPNPRVGAVIVRDGEVVGEGWHVAAGQPHAEINALRQAGDAARGAAMYVTLEPCCHTGRTGPCAEAVINAGVARVVAGCADPNPAVAGGGLRRLEGAGITVACGVEEEAARDLIAGHERFFRTGLPYVVWKYAMTLDGRIATVQGLSRWISGEVSRRFVHRMRRESDAILVGIGTVLADDPLLTARPAGSFPPPYRVVADSRARTPLSARLLVPGDGRVIILTAEDAPQHRVEALKSAGAHIICAGQGRVALARALRTLAGDCGVRSVLLEGGPVLAASMLREGLVCEIVCFVAGKLFGDGLAPLADIGVVSPEEAIAAHIRRIRRFGADLAVFAKLDSACV